MVKVDVICAILVKVKHEKSKKNEEGEIHRDRKNGGGKWEEGRKVRVRKLWEGWRKEGRKKTLT